MSVGWALFLRRTFPQLQQVIVKANRVFTRMDSGVRFNVKDSVFIFSSGFRYQFGQCLHSNDWEQYYSDEYTWIGFDELTAFEEEQYEQITSRCRTDDPVLEPMRKVRAMSNPLQRQEKGPKISVKDPYWVRKRFVDPAPSGRTILRRKVMMEDGTAETLTRVYLPAKLWDNPNKAFVRQYERTLRGKPLHMRKALLEGDWYSVAGGYFEESWNPRIHVCRPFRIPDNWLQFRALDWGFKQPGTVGYFAMDDDGNLIMHREINFRYMDAKQVALLLKKTEKSLGLWAGRRSRIYGPADTQLWENRGDVGKSKAQEMSSQGVSWARADKRSRQRNAERIVMRLKDHGNETTMPGLVIFSTCKMTIQTLPTIGTHPHNPEEPADGGQDHWLDMLGYACAHASNGRAGISMRSASDDGAWDFEGYSQPTVSLGRLGYGNPML